MLVLSGISEAQATNSAESSTNSAIRADSKIIDACAAAANELTEARKLVDALEKENAALREKVRIAETSAGFYKELNETRRSEAATAAELIKAKNETLAAKDALILKQDTLLTELKRQRSPIWKRLIDVMVGVGIGAVVR